MYHFYFEKNKIALIEKNELNILDYYKRSNSISSKRYSYETVSEETESGAVSTSIDQSFNKIGLDYYGEVDCILQINSIDLEKPVICGNNDYNLKRHLLVTADQNTKYENGGTYIILGHNSNIYGHSFNRLKEIQLGDEIDIIHEDSINLYIVSSIDSKERGEEGDFFNQTGENKVILVCCDNENISESGEPNLLIITCIIKE